MNIVKDLVSKDKYGIKCPYKMQPTRIVVHNTANDASARNEIAYMKRNNYETSFHFAVDDKEAVQGIPLDRNAWHASDGNGKGNREGIAIEICYSKSGGDKFIKAEQNAVDLIVYLLKKYNWGIDRVTKHQDYTNKYCPHRTLDMGWDRFIKMIKTALESEKKPVKVNVIYQAHDNVLNKYWSEVVNFNNVNSEGYAGCLGHAMDGLKVKLSNGAKVYYQAHIKGGNWLPVVSKWDNTSEGYAGIYGKDIDGVSMKAEGCKLKYRVHLLNGGWLDWVDKMDINDSVHGMAGIYGRSIDAIQIQVI